MAPDTVCMLCTCLCFCRYARSIVSCVKNARKLQQSLVPEEQGVLRCVWEEASGADWESYTATALAGEGAGG
jgi:hypothetical protein